MNMIIIAYTNRLTAEQLINISGFDNSKISKIYLHMNNAIPIIVLAFKYGINARRKSLNERLINLKGIIKPGYASAKDAIA